MTCDLSSNLAYRGESVVLTVFLEDAPDVQAYQSRIGIVRTAGTGAVSVNCPGGVAINEDRSDYLFFIHLNTTIDTSCASRTATAALSSGGAAAGAKPAYLAEYALTVSGDAESGSTFEISILPSPDSNLVDSHGASIPFAVGSACLLAVRPPALTWETLACSRCVRAPGTVQVALTVRSLDVPINGVQALFHYDPAALSLASVTPGDGHGSPWDAAGLVGVQDQAGSVAAAIVLNGGQCAVDSTVAIATFVTQSAGITAVSFRPDEPPFYTKLTRAADNGAILPDEINAGSLIIGTRSKGDVNGDGLRDGADIQPFLDALLDPGGVSPEQACAADLDGDGSVDVHPDAAMLVDCLLDGNCACP